MFFPPPSPGKRVTEGNEGCVVRMSTETTTDIVCLMTTANTKGGLLLESNTYSEVPDRQTHKQTDRHTHTHATHTQTNGYSA